MRTHPLEALATIYYERLPGALVRHTRDFVEPVYSRMRRWIGIVGDLLPALSLVDSGEADYRLFLVAGRGDVRAFFFERLCGKRLSGQSLGRTPIWRVQRASDSSITATLIEADRCFEPLLRRQGFVAIPEWVLFHLDLSAPWSEIETGWRRHLSDNLRKIRKYDYRCEVTTDLERLRFFHERMFRPHMAARYGEAAAAVSFGYMRSLLERGVLLFARAGGQDVAGFLLSTASPAGPMAAFMGVRDGDRELVKRGAISALYYHCALWAKEQGYRSIDFGHTRPFLRDGLLVSKKRWGMRMQRSERKHRSLYLSRGSVNAEFDRFLSENPVVCEDRGRLRALVFVPGRPGAEELPSRSDWAIPGLHGVRTEPLRTVR